MKTKKLIYYVLLITILSCSKDSDSDPKNTDLPPTNFSITASDLTDNSVTLNWTASTDPENQSITYSVYLNNILQVENITNLTYSITNLDPETNYSVRIVASDGTKDTIASFSFTTTEYINIFNGDVFLSTQQEVDDFGANNYTEIVGELTINGNSGDITSLTSLTSITKVKSLSVGDNWYLVSLDGLNNLSSITENLGISGNDGLINVDELSNLSSIGGRVSIGINESLTNIDGLRNITTIGGDLSISGRALENVNGLSSITSIGGDFHFSSNDLITNIDSLQNLTTINGTLNIAANESLTNLDGLSNLTFIGNNLHLGTSSITNINGLSNLTTIAGYRIKIIGNMYLENLDGLNSNLTFGNDDNHDYPEIEIHYNDSLTNIDGLSSISSNINTVRPPYIEISYNNSLLNIDGLSNIESSIGISIYENPILANVNGLSSLTVMKQNGHLEIDNNIALNNMCGITPLIENGFPDNAGNYLISDNAYNPTVQDILDGNCSL